jgi:hypothetical protein
VDGLPAAGERAPEAVESPGAREQPRKTANTAKAEYLMAAPRLRVLGERKITAAEDLGGPPDREDFFIRNCPVIADPTCQAYYSTRVHWRSRFSRSGPARILEGIMRRGADVPNHSDAPPGAGLIKAVSLLTIALMLVAIAYAGWIAIRNWSHIGV